MKISNSINSWRWFMLVDLSR